MTKFELFCLIYDIMDAKAQQNRAMDIEDEELMYYIIDSNPNIFDDEGSADPTVFEDFKNIIDEEITNENSYDLIIKWFDYLQTKEEYEVYGNITDKFRNIICKQKWIEFSNK